MPDIKFLQKLKQKADEHGAQVVAVSKTKPAADIMELYHHGHRTFGENKVQELTEKQEQLPNDIQWHMIGHLQRNKVKYIAPFVHLIHSADSAKLVRQINKEADKAVRRIPVLLQVHIAEETTKFGFSEAELLEALDSNLVQDHPHVVFRGVMGMATLTDDQDQIRKEFKSLRRFFERLKSEYFDEDEQFSEVSMGMSGDYEIALEEGSTIIRVGSLIFGER